MVRGVTLQRMGREQYKTPDEDVTVEFDRVCQLFQLALGKPSDRVLFESLMSDANEKGLNWIQGLEYVIERRQVEDLVEMPSRRPAAAADMGPSSRSDLRRTG